MRAREKLSAGGPPEAQMCGWLKDRFGLSCQVVLRMMGRRESRKPAAFPSLHFWGIRTLPARLRWRQPSLPRQDAAASLSRKIFRSRAMWPMGIFPAPNVLPGHLSRLRGH